MSRPNCNDCPKFKTLECGWKSCMGNHCEIDVRNKTIDEFVKSLFANDVIDESVVRRVAEQMKVATDEKQIPRKPKMIVTDYGVLTEFQCSACGTIHRANDTKGLSKSKYCDECGQKIDWE